MTEQTNTYLENLKKIDETNESIQDLPKKSIWKISDWYHTFDELYEHRVALFRLLVELTPQFDWKKSYLHHDLTSYDEMFIVVWHMPTTRWKRQVSYHVNNRHWDSFHCEEVAKSEERNWHKPRDVANAFNMYEKRNDAESINQSGGPLGLDTSGM